MTGFEFMNTTLVFVSIFVALELKLGNVFGFGKRPLDPEESPEPMWSKDDD